MHVANTEGFTNCSMFSSNYSNQWSIFLMHCQDSTVITVHIAFLVLFHAYKIRPFQYYLLVIS